MPPFASCAPLSLTYPLSNSSSDKHAVIYSIDNTDDEDDTDEPELVFINPKSSEEISKERGELLGFMCILFLVLLKEVIHFAVCGFRSHS